MYAVDEHRTVVPSKILYIHSGIFYARTSCEQKHEQNIFTTEIIFEQQRMLLIFITSI